MLRRREDELVALRREVDPLRDEVERLSHHSSSKDSRGAHSPTHDSTGSGARSPSIGRKSPEAAKAASSPGHDIQEVEKLKADLLTQEEENAKLRAAAKTLLEENDELKERELPEGEQYKKLYHRCQSKQEEIQLLRLTIQSKEEALALTLEETTRLQPKIQTLEDEKAAAVETLAQRDAEYTKLLDLWKKAEENTSGGVPADSGQQLASLLEEKQKEVQRLQKRVNNTIDKEYVSHLLLKFLSAEQESRLEMARLLAGSLDWDRARMAQLLKVTGSG
ncbi:unnamed protein product [Amoebophrya sp. A25]|nr:unnamed protein product [Amoebophrya sp. A25]|eukprot:GSA25T00017090001.1